MSAESCAGRMQEDPETGARYIYVSEDRTPGCVARTEDLGRCHVYVDYDADGMILGVELL